MRVAIRTHLRGRAESVGFEVLYLIAIAGSPGASMELASGLTHIIFSENNE